MIFGVGKSMVNGAFFYDAGGSTSLPVGPLHYVSREFKLFKLFDPVFLFL